MAFDPIAEGATPFDPQAEGATPVTEQPSLMQTAGNVLDKVSDFFVGRTKDVVGAAFGGNQLNQDQLAANQQITDLHSRSQDLINQARGEKDPTKRMSLLQQSRDLDAQMDEVGNKLSQKTAEVQQAGDISENDLSKGNLQFAAERGAGVAGEMGALLLPFSAEAKGMLAAQKTMNVFQKMLASGIVSGESAAILGITDPKAANMEERAKKGTIDAFKAFATAAVLTGGIEVAKEGLKLGGKVISNILPKDQADRIYASAFNVPSKLAKRIQPIQTAKEISDMGIWGSLDDIQAKADQVTGDGGLLTKVNRDVMAHLQTPIDTGEAQTMANRAMDDAVLVDRAQGRKILTHIADIVRPMRDERIGTKQALDAFDAQKKLEEIGYNYLNKSTTLSPNIMNEQIGHVYLAAADALSTQIDNASVKEGVIDAFKTPEMMAQLRTISPKLADQFSRADSVAEIRSIQKPFVKMLQMIDLTNQYANSPLTKEIGRSSGILNKVVNVALQSPTIRTGSAQVMSGVQGVTGSLPKVNLPQTPGLLETLVGMAQR